MRIGDVEIPTRVVLGPMAGVTNLPYREFMKPFGVGLGVSEMISDCGIDYDNSSTTRYTKTLPMERPVALQLFGAHTDKSVEAVKKMEAMAQYDILDLNFGCPVPKVTKTGAGSAWLTRTDELGDYVKAIVEASTKPVTAKIRLGWDSHSINVFEVSHLLEESGVKAIAIHCRTKEQGYSGKADYEAIRGLQDELSIPLIVSGDIFDIKSVQKANEIVKPQGFMVARGGVGNPYLITQINAYLEDGTILPDPSVKDQITYARDYAEKMIAYFGEATGVVMMRSILPSFFAGLPNGKSIRIALNTCYTKEQIESIFKGAMDRYG